MDLTKYRDKLVGSDEERAVSPVIGVVLMVAVTVILAAVIAAFVMDMGDNLTTEASAGVVIDSEGDTVSATWQSQGNSDYVDVRFEIIDYEEAEENYKLRETGGEELEENLRLEDPGDRESVLVIGAEDPDTENQEVTVEVVATASSDGTSTIVQDTQKDVIVDETDGDLND